MHPTASVQTSAPVAAPNEGSRIIDRLSFLVDGFNSTAARLRYINARLYGDPTAEPQVGATAVPSPNGFLANLNDLEAQLERALQAAQDEISRIEGFV